MSYRFLALKERPHLKSLSLKVGIEIAKEHI